MECTDGTSFCHLCLFYFDIDCTNLMCSVACVACVPCLPYMPCNELDIAGATVAYCIYAFVRILQCKRVGGFTLFSNASENKVKVISHTPDFRFQISNIYSSFSHRWCFSSVFCLFFLHLIKSHYYSNLSAA